MFLLMVPADPGGAAIDKTVAPIVAPVSTPAYLDSTVPVQVADGVTLTFEDGFTVTMAQPDADTALAPPPVETHEDYELGLCLQLQNAKPWIDWGCVG
jgi:hypothetical protein